MHQLEFSAIDEKVTNWADLFLPVPSSHFVHRVSRSPDESNLPLFARPDVHLGIELYHAAVMPVYFSIYWVERMLASSFQTKRWWMALWTRDATLLLRLFSFCWIYDSHLARHLCAICSNHTSVSSIVWKAMMQKFVRNKIFIMSQIILYKNCRGDYIYAASAQIPFRKSWDAFIKNPSTFLVLRSSS